MEYGVIFWGNSVESKGVFQQQKRIIRIMTGSSSRTIYKPLFQKLEIPILPSQCILSLMRYQQTWKFTNLILKFNGRNMRRKIKRQTPSTKLTVYQKGVYYSRIKIQGGSNMTGTDVARFTHKQSRSYLNHLVYKKLLDIIAELDSNKKYI